MTLQLAITVAPHPSSMSNLVNLKFIGLGVMNDFPVGLLLQLSEVFSEENRRLNSTFQDLGLFIPRGDITPENRSELDPSTRRGTMKSGL
jgi:hypothetical protein